MGAGTLEMISDGYAAGFFDGEGSVYAATRRKAKDAARSPTVIVCIANTNLEVLKAHQERWGGSICERKVTKQKCQRQWQWVICTRNAREFLLAILPHLIIKRRIAELALEYVELQSKPASERLDYSRTVERNGRKWVSPLMRPEHRESVLRVFNEMRACNTRTAPANARRAYAECA